MEIRIDDNAGYCFGVVKAIGAAEEELSRDGSLYCLGDIVHNSAEVERLRSLGLEVIDHRRLPELTGKKVLFATTAPEEVKDKLVDYLEENFGCEVIGTTAHLSNRPLLREDMKKYMDKAEVMLTELKAAAVDVATKDAIAAGLEVVYCDNIPVPISGSYPDLSQSILKLVDSAIENFNDK